ncbi:MAG: hypothetical protein ACFUZC_14705 [Chthoniobacteraceae bacterium]
MESPDDQRMDGLSPARQEVIAEAELLRFKKRQRLLDRARGKRGNPVFAFGIIAAIGMIAYFFAILHFKTPPRGELVFAFGAFFVALGLIMRLAYVEQRLNALLELLDEDLQRGFKPKNKDVDKAP